MFLYKSLNINILKRRLYFPQNTYVFLEKVEAVSNRSLRWPFLCLQKNQASSNFAQPELARLPNFLYLRESNQISQR